MRIQILFLFIFLSPIKTDEGEFAFTNKIAKDYIWKIAPICLLVIGTIGNILSIIVFTQKEMRKYSSFYYFAILNIINLVLLITASVRSIGEFNFSMDIRQINLFTCKLHVFLTYFLGHLSSILLTVISIDRVISVVFLNKSKTICSTKFAFKVVVVLFVINFVLSSHFLILESGYYLNNNSTSIIVCQTRTNTTYQMFITQVWKIIDMSLFAFIPFIIMSSCSVIILFVVSRQSKKFQKKQESPLASSSNEHKNRDKKPFVSKLSTRTRNLALMLIPVNVLFILFVGPIVVAIYFYRNLGKDLLSLAILELLTNCNYSFNFFIYFATSSKFREEFGKLFGKNLLLFKNSEHSKVTKMLTTNFRKTTALPNDMKDSKKLLKRPSYPYMTKLQIEKSRNCNQ
jgi:hypothetical protein